MGKLRNLLFGSDDGSTPPKQQKVKLIWLLGALALGIALVLLGSIGDKPGQVAPPAGTANTAGAESINDQPSPMSREEESMAAKLKDMLSQIEGAGKVNVSIRLESSAQSEYALNNNTGHKVTEERDQGGGSRTIQEKTDAGQLVLVRDGQLEMPVVKQERAASIAGVLIVAEGAREPLVKARLYHATKVALGVEPQKIMIMPRERSDM